MRLAVSVIVIRTYEEQTEYKRLFFTERFGNDNG